MIQNSTVYCWLLLLVLPLDGLFAQANPSFDRYRPKVDSLLLTKTSSKQPGLAVAILQAGKTVYAKGFGQSNLENPLPFSPATVSDIGSLAKQMTCFGILLLSQQQKLSLDDDIRRYLPRVPDFGQTITIRHLMNHTSGIREIYAMLALAGWKQGDAIRQEDALQLVQHSSSLNFEPGTQFSYCNTGYMLLAEIIQQVSGQAFEAWMRANVFVPLQMNQTYIMDQQGELFPRCADSYTLQSPGTWLKVYDNSTVIGAGGIYTTLDDLIRWANHLRSPKIGGPELLQQQFQRTVLRNGQAISYALGIEVDQYRGQPVIQHTGSSAGYRAALLYFPKQDCSILIKGNFAQMESQTTAEQIADIILAKDLGPEPIQRIAEPPTAAPSQPGTRPSLSDYVGLYYCPDLATTYEFKVEGNQLVAEHRLNGRLALEAELEGADRFIEKNVLGKIQFERNTQGQVSGLTLNNGELLQLKMVKLR